MNTIRMRTMLEDQVADEVDLGLEDHLLSVRVLMVAKMKMLTTMMTIPMGVEVITKIIIITMKMMTVRVSLMVSNKKVILIYSTKPIQNPYLKSQSQRAR